MKVPKKYTGILFAFVMSVLMALLMSGVLTAVFTGFRVGVFGQWLNGFIHAWPVAFPAIFVIAPLVRKIVLALTEED